MRLHPARLRVPDHVGIYLTYQEICGRHPAFSEITRRLSSLSLSRFLERCAYLNNTFHFAVRTNSLAAFQQSEISHSFSKELSAELSKLTVNTVGNHVIFHRQQQLMLLCLGVQLCDDVVGPLEQEHLNAYSEASLMLNDYLGYDDEELRQLGTDEYALAARWICMTDLSADSELANLFGRAARIWLELLEDKKYYAGTMVPIDQRFTEKYGISIREFLITLTFVATRLWLFDPINEGLERLCLPDSLVSGTNFPKEKYHKAIDLISQTPAQLVTKLVNDPRYSTRFDFIVLRQCPLLRVAPDACLCVDQAFIYKLFSDGVYWRIWDALEGKERGGFEAAFGRAIEGYVADYLRTIYPKHVDKAKPPLLRFGPKFTDKAEMCDVLQVFESYWTIMEIKGSQLTPQAKYTGDPEALRRDLKTKYYGVKGDERKGVAQLAHNISRVLAGDPLKDTAISSLPCTMIYPVLVTYDAALTSLFIQDILDTELRNLLVQGRSKVIVKKLTIISVQDVELMTTIRGLGAMNAVIASYQTFKLSTESFNVFLYRYYKKQISVGKSPLWRSAEKLMHAAGAHLDGYTEDDEEE